MKDIMLKITGKTLRRDEQNELQEDVIEFITQGSLAKRGNITRISYEETELSGMEGCQTSLIISKDKVKMLRRGKPLTKETVMEFEKGKRYETMYDTPFGPLGMEILTNSITGPVVLEDGKSRFSIDYDVSLKGLMESRNTLDIEITNQN